MKRYVPFFILISSLVLASCMKEDVSPPLIILNRDPQSIHYRNQPFIDPGASAFDDRTCNLTAGISIENLVDISKYGNYSINYSVEDAAGNTAKATRNVDIVLPLTDYFDIAYSCFDTCTSGNYFYSGLIQDCDCDASAVTVGNISNFGLSATFTLPVSGVYFETISLDTIKASVRFLGTGTMSRGADSLHWNYSIMDSVSTDACRSVWIKNE